MSILEILQQSIGRVGIKEVARRARLSPSTVSRVGSGLISPSLEVVERISKAVGYHLEAVPNQPNISPPRLNYARDILGRLRNELKTLGVKHAVIYGSVARKEDAPSSDIDVFLDFGESAPKVDKMLKAEGRVIESFGKQSVDVVSDLSSPKGQRLKVQIEKDGIRVF